MATATAGEVLEAIRPVVEATGSSLVAVEDADRMDVAVVWEGTAIAFVRIGSLSDALDTLISRIEEELGAALPDLDRSGKQSAIRMLDERGAFQLRKSIEEVADPVCESHGVVLKVLPTKGIPLQFISYGGSSLVTTAFAFGLVVNVRMRRFVN